MDMIDLRSLSTVLAFMAFIGICLWAYNKNNIDRFHDAANLPFADDEQDNDNDSPHHSHNSFHGR